MATPLTVADLRKLLDKLPDDTRLWAYDDQGRPFATFHPVVHMTHDKRVKGLNFWIDTTVDCAHDLNRMAMTTSVPR